MGRHLVVRTFNLTLIFIVLLLVLSYLEWVFPGHYWDDEFMVYQSHSLKLSYQEIVNTYLKSLVFDPEIKSVSHAGVAVAEVLGKAFAKSLLVFVVSLILSVVTLIGALFWISIASDKGLKYALMIADGLLSIPLLFIVPILVLLMPEISSSLDSSLKVLVTGILLSIRFVAISVQIFINARKRVLLELYSRTWFAMGGGRSEFTFRWAGPLILAPWIQMLPGVMIYFMTGSILIETLFQYQGLGNLFLGALQSRDWALLRPYILWVCISFFAFQFLVDIWVKKLDPRLKEFNL